eukprot:3535354-Amphidinium_carterae.1
MGFTAGARVVEDYLRAPIYAQDNSQIHDISNKYLPPTCKYYPVFAVVIGTDLTTGGISVVAHFVKDALRQNVLKPELSPS